MSRNGAPPYELALVAAMGSTAPMTIAPRPAATW